MVAFIAWDMPLLQPWTSHFTKRFLKILTNLTFQQIHAADTIIFLLTHKEVWGRVLSCLIASFKNAFISLSHSMLPQGSVFVPLILLTLLYSESHKALKT